jgi:D-alanine-D-alanine ligase
MAKQRVAVIFGSRSTEHDVSIVTGLVGVIGPLALTDNYEPIPVYIAKNGAWYSEPDLADIHFYSSGNVEQKLLKFKKVQLLFDDGLWLVKPGLRTEKTKIDIVFPATHGTYGEDGSLMGLLRMANVPFVGNDLAGSTVAMDKWLSRLVTQAAGIDNPKFVGFKGHDYNQDSAKIHAEIKKLKFPLFVKPTHLGSSIAVTRVKDLKELINAIEIALHYDDAVIVEEAISNLVEVTIPVMGNDELRVAMVEEVLSKGEGFFDFTAKYMQGGKGKKGGGKSAGQGGGKYSRMPAKISKTLYRQCEDVAKEAFKVTAGSGYARVDLLINSKTNRIYFNEINPLPGTLQKHNWKEAGVSPIQLVEKLISLAKERWTKQQVKTTTFDSNFLSQF